MLVQQETPGSKTGGGQDVNREKKREVWDDKRVYVFRNFFNGPVGWVRGTEGRNILFSYVDRPWLVAGPTCSTPSANVL